MHEPRLFDSVSLLVSLPDEPYASSTPPPDWHGLRPGDRGAVVDVYENPVGYTVEFFRDGKTVAVADVTPEQVRVEERHREHASALPAVSQRTSDAVHEE